MKCWRPLASFSSSDDMEMCSLKVLELEGSPSLMLLRLMGERGCTTGHLLDYLQTLGNSEALQCLKPPGTVNLLFIWSSQFLVLIEWNLQFIACPVWVNAALQDSSVSRVQPVQVFKRGNILLWYYYTSILLLVWSGKWNYILNICHSTKFTVTTWFMCSPADPHPASVCVHYMWPQPAAQLPRRGQSSSAVPVVQI